MKKIRTAQLGITHEHASGKMEAARRLSDIFEVVGVVDDSASTTARQNALIHTGITDPDAIPHRRVIVRGTKGTFELFPTEPIPYSNPMTLRFTFAENNPEYAKGTHNIELPPMSTRYDAQLIEFARCVRGEIENPYPYEHELLVQEVLLAACGNTNWSK